MTLAPATPAGTGRPPTLLILGAGGDLTTRLLLPGLAGLLAHGGGAGLTLVGCGTDDWTDSQWREHVTAAFADGAATDVVHSSRYRKADVTDPADLTRLLRDCDGTPVLYFALPPAVTVRACQALTGIDVPEGTRLVLEKPFGTDAAAAADLNGLLTRIVPERQIFRVDHFLGMSTVLNILGLRFANRIVEPLLSNAHVQQVEIVFDEDLGLEGRSGYYDHAGALVDMVQSHLLQVLALLTMEPPAALTADDLRDQKALVLRATRVWQDDPVRFTRRAQYTAGTVGSRQLPGYRDEPGIAAGSSTETLAEVAFTVDTWRWAGVPFVLRSGKALGRPRKEVVVTFAPPPKVPAGFTGHDRPDRLRIGLHPDRLQLDLNLNGPGDPARLDPVTLQADFGAGALLPYGEVLDGVLTGDPTLSVRGDTAVQCWHIIQPVLDTWRADRVPLHTYTAGSNGPAGWPSSLVP
ncbi:glucose-6-phosphate dehydrogenase [Dactylosporangium sp. NPDC049525]|uniref:glucose-6-phosphate dehydrogenase n=1 Tax=Dactylosporangium sp. NPDC049525 TaxID=3154730 RepID=UPI003439B1DD